GGGRTCRRQFRVRLPAHFRRGAGEHADGVRVHPDADADRRHCLRGGHIDRTTGAALRTVAAARRTMTVFRDYDQGQLDRQYDQRAWAANAAEVIRRYGENSDRVRARLGQPQAFSYGTSDAET